MTLRSLLVLILYTCHVRLCTAEDSDKNHFETLLRRIEELEQSNVELRRSAEETAAARLQFEKETLEKFAQYEERIAVLETENRCVQDKDNNSADAERSRERRLLLGGDGIVAFTAALSPAYVLHHSNGQTIVFDTIVTNIGGAYNANDGLFVAPVKGLYVLSCSLLDAAMMDTQLHAEIVVNDVVQARVFAHAEPNKYRDQGAQTIFVQINQGDHVRVRHIDEDDGTVGGSLYSTFSGYLLWAME